MSAQAEFAQLHRAIVEAAPEAVIFADRDGIVRLWNHGAETIFGWPAAEAIGRDLDMIIPERFRAGHNAGYRRAMESGQVRLGGRVLTTRSQHRNGSKLYVDLSFGLVKDAAGAPIGAFAIGRDVTARQLEEAAHRAAAQGSPKGP
jgi:PAS domain S-box-containing protein